MTWEVIDTARAQPGHCGHPHCTRKARRMTSSDILPLAVAC